MKKYKYIILTTLFFGGIATSLASKAILRGHIGVLSNQISSEVGNVPGNKFNTDFEIHYHEPVRSKFSLELEKKFQLSGLINDQSLTMLSLQEAYLGIHATSRDHFRLGRQILDWSKVDAIWGFGKLNNRKNFNFFTPGQEGLVGLSHDRKFSNGLRWGLFLSGIYVPELNPAMDYDEKNKSLTSRHPWADAPAQTAEVEGVMMGIQYNLNYPDISDVIYRYSIGAKLGFETEHFSFNSFVMRKPENTITPDVEVNVDFIQGSVNAKIDPRFYYHDIFGSTLSYQNKDLTVYLSGIGIRPNEYPDVDEKVRYTEIKNKKRREDYVGGGLVKANDIYSLGFDYVARLSPFDRNKDELTPDPRWNQAIGIHGQRKFGRNYSLRGDLKYDMLTTDRLVMLEGRYRASKSMELTAGLNMIGTPESGKSFWAPYTNNDSIYGGLRYVY